MDVVKKKRPFTKKQFVAVILTCAIVLGAKIFVENYLDTSYTPGQNPYHFQLKEGIFEN